MRRLYIVSMSVALLLIMVISACGSVPSTEATIEPPTAVVPTIDSPTPESADAEKQVEDFDADNFDTPSSITNKWMPMQPGTQFVYEGTSIDDSGDAVPHRIVITVTDLTKAIGGVRSVVSWDEDYSDGELVEAELAFFAQDNDGNVWRMGEYPEEYVNGEFVAAPTWIHGLADAHAGIAMQANPQTGTPSYAQGWGPAVGWTDRGQVDQMGQEACVPAGCYKDVLVVAETSQAEPDAQQLKYWAPNTGNVKVGWRGEGEKTQEVLELAEVKQLSEEELAQARAKALELEKHAYEVSKDVYANTPPLQDASGANMGSDPPSASEGVPGAATTPEVAAVPASGATSATSTVGEVVVYASDFPNGALSEFEVWDDPAAPGGKLVGTRNTGGHLDPPPENDPHVTFTVPVQSSVPYRCWIHMKVGAPKGESQANVLWVQFSDAVDASAAEVYKPGSGNYMTAHGPEQEGWAWVGCTPPDPSSDPLVRFRTGGEVTVRLQAGMEGVGFDQFVLSPAHYLEQPPTEAVVTK